MGGAKSAIDSSESKEEGTYAVFPSLEFFRSRIRNHPVPLKGPILTHPSIVLSKNQEVEVLRKNA
jgi:hypothetical protein